MRWFEHREDVEEWLRPLGYDAFWREIERYAVTLEAKVSCDMQIESGSIDEETVLTALKALAVVDLVERYELARRPVDMPWISLH
ncbi:hypothetical protein [Mesorhizobium sp. J428]|uniref:hypothetical protein n=1 Tax=Mesorhizobium sp. J428 TaxID=2898440 RepID=UPI002151FCD8|nr:hypothetical protein [Mesorhizobium sp. J428]MCR5858264.1 hypothetical protein [Mesorhizobium sp. J428]